VLDRTSGGRSRPMAIIVALTLVLTAAFTSSVAAQDDPEYRLIAGATGPLVEPWDALYTGFVDKVAELTDGRVAIELHPNGALGGERELLEQVQQGTVDISLASDSPYAIFEPRWSIMSLPYIFTSKEEVFEFLEGDGGQTLGDAMVEKGVRILAYGENGFRQMSNSKLPIESVDDLQGIKMRVIESPPLRDWFESIGAVPTVIPFPELYPALQQGVVEGQDNGMATATLLNFQEVQEYWSDTNHVFSSIPIAINEKKWQSFPEDIQAAILQAAQVQAQAERDSLTGVVEASVADIGAMGGTVTTLSDEARAGFVESARPIWQKYADKVGEDFMDQTFEALGREWR